MADPTLDREAIKMRQEIRRKNHKLIGGTVFGQQVADFDALLAALERAERERVAVCCECGHEVTKCDEDRCCAGCGVDLVVCADKYSAEVLVEQIAARVEAIRRAEAAERKGAEHYESAVKAHAAQGSCVQATLRAEEIARKHAEGEAAAMALAISHEGHIETLTAERDEALAESDAWRRTSNAMEGARDSAWAREKVLAEERDDALRTIADLRYEIAEIRAHEAAEVKTWQAAHASMARMKARIDEYAAELRDLAEHVGMSDARRDHIVAMLARTSQRAADERAEATPTCPCCGMPGRHCACAEPDER